MTKHFKKGVFSSLAPVLFAVLTGCSTHIENLRPVIDKGGAKQITFETPYHSIFAIDNQKNIKSMTLWVFIEGDGRAWISRTTPGTDPTPRQHGLINRVLGFPDQALYLARPCQFVRGPECNVKVWTENRFSTNTIDAYHAVLDQIKQRQPELRFNLVGYSGGATIATKLAGSRDDVNTLQTIAGNLDPHAWVQWHGYSPVNSTPLSEPELDRLKRMAQRHFMGIHDTVIPVELTESVMGNLKPDCAELVLIQTNHSQWDALPSEKILSPISCGN